MAWFVLLTLIRWIVIYPVDSVIQPLNNRGLDVFRLLFRSSSKVFFEKYNDPMLPEFLSSLPDLAFSDVLIIPRSSSFFVPSCHRPNPEYAEKRFYNRVQGGFLLHVCDKIDHDKFGFSDFTSGT